jgi:hypothetical protein
MTDEAFNHRLRAIVFNHTLTAVIIHRQLLEGPRGSHAHGQILIFEQLLKVGERVIEQLAADSGNSKAAKKERGLLTHFSFFALEELGGDGQNLGINHLISGFLNCKRVTSTVILPGGGPSG